MSITARLATSADTPVLVDLMQEFYAESSYPLNRSRAAATFSALLASSTRGAAWLLYEDTVCAGYVVLTLGFSMEYGGVDAFLDDLFIRPANRGRGLGRHALKVILADCRQRGVVAVHVVVGQDNAAAKALYGSFGFRLPMDGRETLTARLGDDSAES